VVSYRYSHMHINTANMDKAVEFYQRMFDAKVVSRGQNLPGRTTAALDINGFRLLISDKLYPLGSPIRSGDSSPHLGLEHFGLEADDFDQAIADLKAKGAEFLMEPHEFRPGFRIAFVKAPDNVRIEIQGRTA